MSSVQKSAACPRVCLCAGRLLCNCSRRTANCAADESSSADTDFAVIWDAERFAIMPLSITYSIAMTPCMYQTASLEL